ncbi:MAG: LPS-assembly lipoprotein LptE, partial [Pseudomonadales bacterium]
VAEYQLNEEVDFLITKPDGTPLTPLSTASVERSYEFREQDILSADTEERILRNSMHKEVVRQILNHLRAVANRANVPHGSNDRIGQ